MAEIAEEVRLRRASGDLPPKLERELDELFLAHSPVAGRGGDLGEALRMVDAATFIDPVVPVESERAAGAVVKKGMRSLLLWYVGWVTHQMSQSAAAVSRALHIVDDRLQELERQVEVQRVPARRRGRVPRAAAAPDAWWVEPAVAAVAEARGPHPPRRLRRRLVGPAHRGRRRRRLRRRSPLPASSTRPSSARSTCAASPWPSTCAPWPPAGLGGRRAERHRRGDGGRRAGPAARRDRHPARPGRDARHPLGDPGGLGGRRRAARGRPGAGPAAAARGVVPPPRAGRVRGRRPGPARTVPTSSSPPSGPASSRRTRPPSGERRRRGAGGRPPVHPHPQPARRDGDAHAHAARRPARAPVGARRSSPRRSTTTWPPRPTSTGCTPSTRRQGDVAIYQFTTSSAVARLPGRARAAADPGLPQLHRARVLRRLGAPQRGSGRPGRPRSSALLAPAGRCSGWPRARFSEQELRRAGCRRTAVVPVLADYRRVTATPDPRVAGRAGRGCGAAVAPTSSSSGGSCPPRPSTSWSRRCGPTAASTTPGPACTSSGARRASSTTRRCSGSSTTSA